MHYFKGNLQTVMIICGDMMYVYRQIAILLWIFFLQHILKKVDSINKSREYINSDM